MRPGVLEYRKYSNAGEGKRKMKPITNYFGDKIWTVKMEEVPKKRAMKLQFFRVTSLTAKFFIRNRCTLHASALTYFTMLSLVPVAALFFGVAKGYGFDKVLKNKIHQGFAAQEQTASQIIQFAENALDHASGGVVAGVGVVLLIWSALKLFSNVESTFNEIWGVRRGRSFARKVSDYLTMLILCPMLFVILITSTTLIMSYLQILADKLPFSTVWNVVLLMLTNLFPIVLACLLFTLIYIFIPNTKVQFKPALTAGIFTGILYIALQFGYIFAQKVLTGYNAIYGSFAAIPFLLIWLQLSWALILLGAQIAFSVQNVNAYELTPPDGEPESADSRARTAIRIVAELAAAFKEEQGPVSLPELSRKLESPIRLTRAVLFDLCACGLASRLLADEKKSELYQIAVPVDRVTPVFVLRRLATHGYPGYQTPQCGETAELMEALWSAAEASPANKMPLSGNGPRNARK